MRTSEAMGRAGRALAAAAMLACMAPAARAAAAGTAGDIWRRADLFLVKPEGTSKVTGEEMTFTLELQSTLE